MMGALILVTQSMALEEPESKKDQEVVSTIKEMINQSVQSSLMRSGMFDQGKDNEKARVVSQWNRANKIMSSSEDSQSDQD